jgi:hypothetical protein
MKFQTASAVLLASVLLLGSENSDAYSFTPRRSFGLESRNLNDRITQAQNQQISASNNVNANRRQSLEMKEDGGSFSLSSLFGNNSKAKKAATPEIKMSGSNAATMEAHPSVRDHISPLNQLRPENLSTLSTETQPPPGDTRLPIHPNIKSGVLSNGLSYVILPNKSPAGRFEAHLQVFSGSADELEPQQGIAHLTEHVAYMGSRKRERLFGTGSQTNAYTDFHHTVFYAVCPTYTPRSMIMSLCCLWHSMHFVMLWRQELKHQDLKRNVRLYCLR